MRKLLYLSLFLLVGCSEKKANTDAQQMQLEGNIESVRIESFKAEEKFGSVERGKATEEENYFVLFDKNGNQKERIFYNKKGEILKKYTYIYNEKKQREEVNLWTEKGDLSHKFLYKYDENGNRIEINDYTADGKLFIKEKQTFNAKNYSTGKISYNAEGKMLSERKIERDKKGNIQEEIIYGSDGQIKTKTIYSYDEKGLVTKEERYANNGMLANTKTHLYKFDSNENWIQRIDYQNSKPTSVVSRKIIYANDSSFKEDDQTLEKEFSSIQNITQNTSTQTKMEEIQHQPFQKIEDGYYNFYENENMMDFAKRIMPKFQERITLVKNNLTTSASEENDRIYSSFLKENNILLESLNDKLYEGFNHNEADSLNKILTPYGLELILADGDSIELDKYFYSNLFSDKLSPESNDFMNLSIISDYLYFDAGVTVSLEKFGEYIYALENFVTNYPNSRKSFNLYFKNNKEKLAYDIEVYLLGKLDNHYNVVWSFSNNKLTAEAIFEFKRYAKAHPTSKVTDLIYILLDNPTKTQNQLTSIIEREIQTWLK